MGILIGKLRKKKSTCEILEKLDTEIKSIEEFRRNTEQTHKKIVGRFILVSVFVYLVTAFIFYFYFFPASMYERLIYVVPLVSAPVIIVSVKRTLTWYYNRELKKNHDKLVNLREEKKKMLDNVMETETYKIAKSILEKYAPEQVRKPPSYNESSPKVLTPAIASIAANQSVLRYRGYAQPPSGMPMARHSIGGPLSTPVPPRSMLPPPTSVLSKTQATQSIVPSSRAIQLPMTNAPGSPLLLPRAVLPRDRSVLDKMVDYLVGDGPSSRYALICKQCSSHNGMALKEEFEYLSFRCCYCSTFNPARKQKPAAPKLECEIRTSPRFSSNSDSSDSERHSQSSDSESEIDKKDPDEIKPNGSGGDSPDIKLSDADKLSDIEQKASDEEGSPMEIDSPCASDETAKQIVERIDDVTDDKITELCVSSGVEDVKSEETKQD